MNTLDLRFKDRALTLDWPFLKASLYRATYPGDVASPLATLEVVSQVNTDSVIYVTTCSVQEHSLLVYTVCLPLGDPFLIYAVSQFVH